MQRRPGSAGAGGRAREHAQSHGCCHGLTQPSRSRGCASALWASPWGTAKRSGDARQTSGAMDRERKRGLTPRAAPESPLLGRRHLGAPLTELAGSGSSRRTSACAPLPTAAPVVLTCIPSSQAVYLVCSCPAGAARSRPRARGAPASAPPAAGQQRPPAWQTRHPARPGAWTASPAGSAPLQAVREGMQHNHGTSCTP